MSEFSRHISKPESDGYIASHCDVYTDDIFIHVNTDDHEGDAMFTLPVAHEVFMALGDAIRFAEQKRERRGEED